MNEKQIMKFECLPNEILIDCFEYLNAPDIFYAFEQLNHRFYQLIRTIQLSLDFQDIHKSMFDRFCKNTLIDPTIQRQIYSLKLSNKNTHGQIHAFLTYFSLIQFIQLRSLTLIDVKENNVEPLSIMLPLLSELIYFRLIDSLYVTDELISKLPMSKPFGSTLSSFQEIIPLRKLSVDYPLQFNHLYKILQHMPLLQYLNASSIYQSDALSSADINLLYGRVNHLKHLIITNFRVDVDNLMNFIAHMFNLRSLTVSVYENSDIIDAFRWQHLITSSLSNLTVFKFKFGIFNRNEIVQKYEHFQSDFWIKEHQWYTECLLGGKSLSYIFTIPYLIDSRPLWLKFDRHYNKLTNHAQTFDHVKYLYLPEEELIKSNDFYFSNITSLIIESLPVIVNEDDEEKFINSLKRIINLSNIKHLEIPICCETVRPTILLKILKEASHLSSLNIHNCALEILKNNDELCQYTNRMIQKLQFQVYFRSHACKTSRDLNSVHQVFLNIEQFNSYVFKPDRSLFLLNNLPKLSKLTIDFHQTQYFDLLSSIKDELSKLNNILFYEDKQETTENVMRVMLGIWVDRNHITI